MIFGLDQLFKKPHAPHMSQVENATLPAFSVNFPVGRVPFSDRIVISFNNADCTNTKDVSVWPL